MSQDQFLLEYLFKNWEGLTKGVSGIFVLSQDEGAFVETLDPGHCATPIPLIGDSQDGNSYLLCKEEDATNEMLDTTWHNPDITGVILRLNWSKLQVDNNGVIEYDWSDLDRDMNRAV
jgi:hypothetical protein